MTNRSPDAPAGGGGFLARWSRVKSGAGAAVPPAVAPAGTATPSTPRPAAAAPLPGPPSVPALDAGAVAAPDAPLDAATDVQPPPTIEDAAALAPGSEVSRFMARDVAPEVRHAALKQLFADPSFNVMDGLDIYIDDYGRPDPLPASWLRKMASAASLDLFTDDADGARAATPADAAAPAIVAAAPPSSPSESPVNEDPDLRLQPDDADRPPGPGAGAGADPGRER